MSMAERKTMTRAVKNPVKRKLTRAEKKEIAAVIQAAKGDGKPRTAQQTIPYLQMYPDGICRVTEKKYSKSLVFEDINYQLAQADDKTAIFERKRHRRLSKFRRRTTLLTLSAGSTRICLKISLKKATTDWKSASTLPFPLKRTILRRQKPAFPVSKPTYSIILRCLV